MPKYTFQETIDYFSTKMESTPPQEDVEAKTVEILVDHLPIVISESPLEGSLKMEIVLGLLLKPIQEEKLKELTTSNFLGMNTGGCTFSWSHESGILFLRSTTSAGTPPQENWEWLHRMLYIATEWTEQLIQWEEFVRLANMENKR